MIFQVFKFGSQKSVFIVWASMYITVDARLCKVAHVHYPRELGEVHDYS